MNKADTHVVARLVGINSDQAEAVLRMLSVVLREDSDAGAALRDRLRVERELGCMACMNDAGTHALLCRITSKWESASR